MDDELALAAPPDPVVVGGLRPAVDPLADELPGEADLLAGADPDAHDDVVEALAEPLLDVDIALERRRDRRGEVAAGELLRALIELEVSLGDVDGLVRHGHIVTFILCGSIYVSVYVYPMGRQDGGPNGRIRASDYTSRIRRTTGISRSVVVSYDPNCGTSATIRFHAVARTSPSSNSGRTLIRSRPISTQTWSGWAPRLWSQAGCFAPPAWDATISQRPSPSSK